MNVKTNDEKIYQMSLPTPFPVGDVNIFLVKGDALTLVDTGPKTKEAWDSFQFQLKEAGYSVEDIEQVLLTHHHPDHAGLLDFFPDEIDVMGHPYLNPFINRDEAFFSHHQLFMSTLLIKLGIDPVLIPYIEKGFEGLMSFSCHRPLTKVINEGMDIDGLEGWEVVETLGHAQSHLSFYHSQFKVMLGGDLLIKNISSNPLIEPPLQGNERPRSLLQYNDSLRKLMDRPIDIVYPGHGERVEHVHKLVEHRLKKQHERALQVLSFVNESTVFDLCVQLFPKVYKKQTVLTLSETIGQLDYLEDMGKVECREENGILRYYKR
ncbi:MBL fold metallo-hydrolase [Bacillus carboniphilus]|uniref:MBL fold metallo-hydrolase n=1 Tax=Bacillus carboniphilus TaxID=86663 RepID=A0ABY9JZH3_9BACI|nr:MBL fold metallo-hydrolase [Bacillus carboniphilus]WLR43845.1 MBL fold metallo-hydrolase [Bacillus carboniphilus]